MEKSLRTFFLSSKVSNCGVTERSEYVQKHVKSETFKSSGKIQYVSEYGLVIKDGETKTYFERRKRTR